MPAGSSGCIRYSSQVCSTCLLHVRTTLLVIGYVFIPAILLQDCQVGSRSPCDAHSLWKCLHGKSSDSGPLPFLLATWCHATWLLRYDSGKSLDDGATR